MRDREPCVYILTSGFNGTLYVGVTSNLIGRVMQHRDGAFDGFTRRCGIKRLVWYDATDTMDAAIASEKRMKGWPRDWKKNLIERDNPHWDDLAVALGLLPLGRTVTPDWFRGPPRRKPNGQQARGSVDPGTSPG